MKIRKVNLSTARSRSCRSPAFEPLGRVRAVRTSQLLSSARTVAAKVVLLLVVAASARVHVATSFAIIGERPITSASRSSGTIRKLLLLSSATNRDVGAVRRASASSSSSDASAAPDPPLKSPSSAVAAMDQVDSSINYDVESTTEGLKGKGVVDRSTLTLLEHVNLNIPCHEPSLTFYYTLLGCGMDPRKADNLLQPGAKHTVWANCGASQFHLPRGDVAQVIPGSIGLRYDSLEPLKSRLDSIIRSSPDVIQSHQVTTDRYGGEVIRVVDKYGNVFVCRGGGNPVSDSSWKQPVIRLSDVERWGWVAERYGCHSDDTECRGLDFVEFYCPMGTADKIALFYDSVFDATTSVVDATTDDGSPTRIAIVAFGNVDSTGKADQSLVFRETTDSIPPYDGHHVALYVGDSQADFEQAFKNCEQVGVVWVNPRFDDKATNLQGAKKWMQFRFKNIVDMETGEPIFELEHEVRSVRHKAWPGAKEYTADVS